MKRDWKLIRAILLEESLERWTAEQILQHRAMCIEAGWMKGLVLHTAMGGKQTVTKVTDEQLTRDGREVAAILTKASDLDAVLRWLDRHETGHVTEFVLDMMKQPHVNRLAGQPEFGGAGKPSYAELVACICGLAVQHCMAAGSDRLETGAVSANEDAEQILMRLGLLDSKGMFIGEIPLSEQAAKDRLGAMPASPNVVDVLEPFVRAAAQAQGLEVDDASLQRAREICDERVEETTGLPPVMDRLQNRLCMMAPEDRGSEDGRLMAESVQRIAKLTAALSVSVTDVNAMRGALRDHQERIAAAAWQPIETAPRDGTEIIVGFDCATQWVVHLAWWRGLEDWMRGHADWSEADVGWWSYVRGSVTQEKLEGSRAPTHWLPCPPWPNDQSDSR